MTLAARKAAALTWLRGLTTDGLQWQCYIGQKAVDEQIVGQGFLGETVSGPGRG